MRSLMFVLLLLGLLLISSHSLRSGQQTTSAPFVVPFEVKTAGNVSVVVCDSAGHVVRELLHAVPKQAGKHHFVWDGLGRDGKAVPAGDYTWKLLQTPGFEATYLMSLGTNFPPGTEWSTACGPGTHNAPFGIAVDKTGIYVAAHTTENIETCMLKMSLDGKERSWSALTPRAWDGSSSLAVDDGEVFMLGHVMTTDARVEKEKKAKQLVYAYDAATGKLAKRTVTGTNIGPMPFMIDVQWDHANNDLDASDMDARDGALVVAYEKRNALRWYDPKSGKLLDTIEIAAPQGITIGEKGIVYAVTGDRIVSLSREKRTPVEVVKGLDKPGRIDVDRSTRELLVYLAGPQQIHRYSPDGKRLNIYGEQGGRKDGLYDDRAKRSFNGFADLCADGAGGFYVTESNSAPRRTSHFARDGSVLREWYGGQRWAPHAAPEPDNPNVVWVGSQYGWIMRCLVDYERKTWSVHSCFKYVGMADGLVGDSHNEGCYFRIYKHAGATYLVLERLPTILKVDEKNWKLVPATIVGGVGKGSSPIHAWAGKHTMFQWNDANGDGAPQRDEVTYYEGGMPSSYEPYVAPDFTCFTASQDKGTRKVYRFPATGWTASGAPVYGTLPKGEVFGACPPRFDPNHFADSRWSLFFHQNARTGQVYGAFNDWTRDWCDYADGFMHKWSAQGESQWTVGQKGVPPVLPGEVLQHLRGIAGIAHDCVVAIDVDGGWFMKHVALAYVWDPDGLYVGGLFDRPNLEGIAKYWYQCSGEFCHASVHTFPSGDVLFYGNWENEVRVYRISGWNGWTRQSGTIHLDQASKPHTGQGLTLARFEDAEMTKLRDVAIDKHIDVKGTNAAALRWTGTLLPDYGPSYVGPWTVRGDKESFGGSFQTSRDNGASVIMRFHGKSIAVVGSTGPSSGFADISIDGQKPKRVDTYSAKTERNVTLFSKDDLPAGDHDITVTVVGWYVQPRNKASTDAWVAVDKFVIDGQDFDDAGMPYTFSAEGDGKLRLWLDFAPVSFKTQKDKKSPGPTVKLQRRPHAIEVHYQPASGNAALAWSSPLESKQPIATRSLYPVPKGGYTVENVRRVEH